MNLLKRLIAKWLGFQHPLTELIVFRNQREARQAGFMRQRHSEFRYLVAWWPGLGVRGLYFGCPRRITVPSDMLHMRLPEGDLRNLLQSRQAPWGDKAIWIEL